MPLAFGQKDKGDKHRILSNREKYSTNQSTTTEAKIDKLEQDEYKTGFVPFFDERDKLGRILGHGNQIRADNSPEATRSRLKRRLKGMVGHQLTQQLKSKKPKLNVASDLMTWINAGGADHYRDDLIRPHIDVVSEMNLSEENDVDDSDEEGPRRKHFLASTFKGSLAQTKTDMTPMNGGRFSQCDTPSVAETEMKDNFQ